MELYDDMPNTRFIPKGEIFDYIHDEVNMVEQRVAIDSIVLNDMLRKEDISAIKTLNDRLGFNLKQLAQLYLVCALEDHNLSVAYISQALRADPDFKISEKVRMGLSSQMFYYEGLPTDFRRSIILTYPTEMVVSINRLIEAVRMVNTTNHQAYGLVHE